MATSTPRVRRPSASAIWVTRGDRTHPYNVFDFTINRKRDGPHAFFASFHGYLHADAFSGYDGLYLPQRCDAAGAAAPILEVACNAHAPQVHEARGSDAVRAHQALAYYAQLCALEQGASAATLDDNARRAMRQELAVPILEQFQSWSPKPPCNEPTSFRRRKCVIRSEALSANWKSPSTTLAQASRTDAVGRHLKVLLISTVRKRSP